MSELKKATLQEISSDEKSQPLGPEVAVQFNPTTLKLQITNNLPGGKSRGNQVRQYTGSSSTTLSLDLVFDTADEGATDAPRSVREKTAIVEKFVLPKGQEQSKQAPPKLRFQWGNLIVDGIVDSVSLDFDHFAADGTPLRAKVSLAIKEQDSKYQFLAAGPGANKGGNKPQPGQPTPGVPGSLGLAVSASAQATLALGGESAAELAARVGVDPAAWRGLSTGLSNPLSLEAGLEVGFSTDLNINAGLGVTGGFAAGASTSLEASVGLEANACLNAVAGVGVGAELAAGFALAAAGGVSAAVQTVQIVKAQTAEQQARQAFGMSTVGALAQSPAAAGTAPVALGAAGGTALPAAKAGGTSGASLTPTALDQSRSPLAGSGLLSPTAQQNAPAAPVPPQADPRATSFGFGVPLRSTVGQAAKVRAGALQGQVALRPQIATDGTPPLAQDPTTPPWVSLPAQDYVRQSADTVQHRNRPLRPCGCRGACRHRGGR
jgi:hypothetical protein